jgi:hypothetical protein
MTITRLRVGRLFPLAGAVTLATFTGCASSTVLQTQPPGARVSINGAYVGQTPFTLTDTKIIYSQTPIHFEYPGYAPLDVTLVRSEEPDVLPIVAGFFCLIPWLWVFKYQSNHIYTLQPPGAPGFGQTLGLPPAAGTYPQQGYPQQGYPQQGYPQQQRSGPAGYPPPPPGYPPPAQ